jgi:hypothetical protein
MNAPIDTIVCRLETMEKARSEKGKALPMVVELVALPGTEKALGNSMAKS